MEKKEHKTDLAEAAKAVLKASLTHKKHAKVPKGESDPVKLQDSSKSWLLKESSLQPRSSRALSRARL
jgi:hypothetical protein